MPMLHVGDRPGQTRRPLPLPARHLGASAADQGAACCDAAARCKRLASWSFCFRSDLHLSLQVFTSSQQSSQTLRHVNGRLQVSQTLLGKCSFFTPLGMLWQRRNASHALCVRMVDTTNAGMQYQALTNNLATRQSNGLFRFRLLRLLHGSNVP